MGIRPKRKIATHLGQNTTTAKQGHDQHLPTAAPQNRTKGNRNQEPKSPGDTICWTANNLPMHHVKQHSSHSIFCKRKEPWHPINQLLLNATQQLCNGHLGHCEKLKTASAPFNCPCSKSTSQQGTSPRIYHQSSSSKTPKPRSAIPAASSKRSAHHHLLFQQQGGAKTRSSSSKLSHNCIQS
ncbi:hypothetical protein Nepgr_014771 [Nepenthes gracilis]|uniref:Uncharacterized protein n=1 Tax=Nepenthes gracilis TaxID=150966 RepID=A0AAD3XQT8_NEPGR|nr:hypothetical protein Nepgr_014771 [Nepenthes gracilis]